MAMNDTPAALEALDAGKARLAGLVATIVSLAATVAVGVWVFKPAGSDAANASMLVGPLVLLLAAIGLIFAVALAITKQVWAQQTLLTYWLVLLVAAVAMALALTLWKVSDSTAETLGLAVGSANKWIALIALAGIVVCGILVALLAAASKPSSRQRYASMVFVSISFAVAAVLAVNMLADKKPLHKSWETLGRYGMSDRTRKILKDLNTPVRLTCVYTSTEKGKKASEYRPRVLDLLEDMKLFSDKVTVDNVTTDAGKARLLARLRGPARREGGSPPQVRGEVQQRIPDPPDRA